jgi:putative effector of murein hydrolase LrgA (UPF0299 family)
MSAQLTLVFACQLAGELIVATLMWPLPGPVVGMAILFVGLVVNGAVPDDLAAVSAGLLDNLSLLFIPAGVGVMLHAPLLARDGVAIGLALVVSTVLTIAVTALVMARMARPEASPSSRIKENE